MGYGEEPHPNASPGGRGAYYKSGSPPGRGEGWVFNSPFEGGRALKICPVGKFSEGARLQGRFVVGAGGCKKELN